MGLLGWLIGADIIHTIGKAIEEDLDQQYNKGYEDRYNDGLTDDVEVENEDDDFK